MAAASTPTTTGTRSRLAPCSVASTTPPAASRARDSAAATALPTMAQAASASSAPSRRYQRNPYTVATAVPPGRELVMAWEARVIPISGPAGARRPPAPRSRYWTPANATSDAASTSTAGGSHHQRRWPRTAPNPESSLRWPPRTSRARMRTPMPNTHRSTGHQCRSDRPNPATGPGPVGRIGGRLSGADRAWRPR